MIAELAALKAQLATDSAIRVYDAARRNTDGTLIRDTYLLLFPHPGDRDDDRLSAPQSPLSDTEFDHPIRFVSISSDGVLQLFSKVDAVLTGRRLVVSGRSCSPIELDADPVEADMTVNPPLFYMNAAIAFKSDRA